MSYKFDDDKLWVGVDGEGDLQVYVDTMEECTNVLTEDFFERLYRGTLLEDSMKNFDWSIDSPYYVKKCVLPWEFLT